jgi:hypothetical protein
MVSEPTGLNEADNLRHEIQQLELMNRALSEALAHERGRADALDGQLGALYRSTSWRLSAPIRWLSRRIGKTT